MNTKTKAFISYCHDNDDKRLILDKLLRSHRMNPIVVASRNKPAMLLATKVQEAIEEAEYLIPILTSQSIQNQWVNQEIGYAIKLVQQQKIRVIPIVELTVMDGLKGFIHKQMDLPFVFKSNAHNGVENKSFKAECERLINYLKKNKVTKTIGNSNFELEATYSHLSLIESWTKKIDLSASLVIRNTGNEVILIREIKFAFQITFNLYNSYGSKTVVTKKIIYESRHYNQNHKSISLKIKPLMLKPKEIKSLHELIFTPQAKVPDRYQKRIYDTLTYDFPKLKIIPTIFVQVSGEKTEQKVKVLY
jgi:hypothetical protein